MFNVKVLERAITDISPEGQAEVSKMITMFDEMKDEVAKLKDISEGFEQIAKNLELERDSLIRKLNGYSNDALKL